MAIHVKTKWHKTDNKTIEDFASVLTITVWKVGVQSLDHIGDENFQFKTVQQRFAVLTEILIFLVQVIDRWTYERITDDERHRLITALVLQLAATIDENQNDWLEKGDYQTPFLTIFNERAHEYASFNFVNDAPGYQFRRYLGERVLAIMGIEQGNRWVIDQVMDIEIPDALKILQRSLHGLFKNLRSELNAKN